MNNTNPLENSENIIFLGKYYEKLDYYKEKRKKYILINTQKEIVEGFHIKYYPNFNNFQSPYISLEAKFLPIICGLDSTNQNIIETHEIWEEMNTEKNIFHKTLLNTYHVNRLLKLLEYIIYDLYQVISQIIATVYLITHQDSPIIRIGDIGQFLNEKNNNPQSNFNYFDEYYDFIQTINHIFNAYKHSYPNKESILLGRDEICFTAIRSPSNNLSKKAKVFCVSLDQTISIFNKFYSFSFNLIDSLTK